MKKVLLGIIIGLFLFPALHELALALFWEDTPIVVEYGYTKVFKKYCTKDVGKNGHGWIFINREYFECGKLAITLSDFLYGEYTKPRDLQLEKKACKGCTL